MRLVPGISRRFSRRFCSDCFLHAFAADDGGWTVSKSSGEVWIDDLRRPAGIAEDRNESLKPGDTIRTGRTGRVLLMRGEESMMIAPNSVVGLPAENKEGLSTTIVSRLARSCWKWKSERQAFRGRDALSRRSGQGHAVSRHGERRSHQRRRHPRPGRGRRFQIRPDRPGDAGPAGDQLRARQVRPLLEWIGHLNPIEQGKPRAPSVDRIPVPKNGLSAPRHARQIRPWTRRRRPCQARHEPAAEPAGGRKARRDADLVLAWRGAAEFPR